VQPFIRNHQLNVMKQQAAHIQNTWNTVADPVIRGAVTAEAVHKVTELFAGESPERQRLIEPFAGLKTEAEFNDFFDRLMPYVIRFPQVTEKQAQKLFPKAKKLALPEAAAYKDVPLTYLSWIDIASNKWHLIYERSGEAVGIEGSFLLAPKKNMCAFCGGYGQVALVSAVTKAKSAVSPDYYKSVGQYVCANAEVCNLRITDVSGVEAFIHEVLK
jgi:hypothetical protein